MPLEHEWLICFLIIFTNIYWKKICWLCCMCACFSFTLKSRWFSYLLQLFCFVFLYNKKLNILCVSLYDYHTDEILIASEIHFSAAQTGKKWEVARCHQNHIAWFVALTSSRNCIATIYCDSSTVLNTELFQKKKNRHVCAHI